MNASPKTSARAPMTEHCPGTDGQTRASVLAALPGTDFVEAVTVLRGELGAPHRAVLPVLAARGDVADVVPRTGSVLTELYCDLQPHGWRLTRQSGKESRAATALLASDVNALADVVGGEDDGDRGPVTVELLGPITLAARLHLHNGEKVLQDHGARRDVADALADGVQSLLRSIQHSVDGREVVLRLAEPDLERAVNGLIPTASGYRTLRAVPRPEMDLRLRTVAEAARGAGAAAVELVLPNGADPRRWAEAGADMLMLTRPGPAPQDWEPIAAMVEHGLRIGLLVPELTWAQDSAASTGRLVEGIVSPWTQLGLAASLLRELIVAPVRGLEETTPGQVRAALKRTTDLAHGLQQTALED